MPRISCGTGMVLLCLATTLLAATRETSDSIEWEKTAEGETAYVPMKAAPFPHSSREKGFAREKKTFPRDPHYADSTVGLFVPRGYRATPKTDVLIYLHGWSNNVRKAMAEFKLREQIVASGRNIILIFPEGPRDAEDSGCGKLEDKDGLKQLVAEALATLRTAGKIKTEALGQVLIAGHSGAYKGLACSADHGGLDEHLAGVCLLDASYGNLDMFVGWVKKHPESRFFSVFTDHLAAQNVTMFTRISKFDQHCTLQLDIDATDDSLARTHAVFLHTEKLTHDETVRWLERWLRAFK